MRTVFDFLFWRRRLEISQTDSGKFEINCFFKTIMNISRTELILESFYHGEEIYLIEISMDAN